MMGGSRQKHAGVSPFAVLKYVRLGEFRRARGHEEMRQLFKPGGEGEDDYSLKPFIRTNSLFLHLPKTAGVSISRALYGCLAMGHSTLGEYRAIFRRQAFARMFKFTFVRNPFDRIHSAYHFLRSGGMGGLDAEFDEQVLRNYPSFEQFVLEGLNDRNVASFWHFLPDTHFLSYHSGRPLELDFVGRFESLERDFDVVRSRVNPAAVLGHFNRTAAEDYRGAYTLEMIERTALQYADDLHLFGYEFDGPARPIRLTPAADPHLTMRP